MATCTPWKNFTKPPLTCPAATANIAPTRIGQHQLPMSAGTAAHRVHTATQMDLPSSSLFPGSVPPVFLAGGGPGGPQLPSGQSGSSGCNIGVSNDSGSLEMSDSVGALPDGSFAEGLLDMASVPSSVVNKKVNHTWTARLKIKLSCKKYSLLHLTLGKHRKGAQQRLLPWTLFPNSAINGTDDPAVQALKRSLQVKIQSMGMQVNSSQWGAIEHKANQLIKREFNSLIE